MNETSLKIWGSPGTGKTTTLINLIEDFTKDKEYLDEVVFCTYRKNMAAEFVGRLKQKYNIYDKEERELLKYFGTFHAICLKRIKEDLGTTKVVDKEDIVDFCNKHKISVNIEKIKNDDEEDTFCVNKEDGIFNKYQRIHSWCVNNLLSFRNCVKFPTNGEILGYDEFMQYDSLWSSYKEENNMIDFDDMLLRTVEQDIRCPSRVFIVDEFQDLSPIQHKIYSQWKKDSEIVYIAGDPNQAIYSFMGATPTFFNVSDLPRVELGVSYRLPNEILDYSFSLLKKGCLPIPDVSSSRMGGIVKRVRYENMFDIIDENRTSFILCRANYLRGIVRSGLQDAGIFYSGSLGINQTAVYDSLCLLGGGRNTIPWPSFRVFLECIRASFLMEQKNKIKKPDYFRGQEIDKATALRFLSPFHRFDFLRFPFDFGSFCMASKFTKTQGEKINDLLQKHSFKALPTGVVEVLTIHGSKGREAQDVFVLDAITPRILDACDASRATMQEEVRVFYVACTRSKERLFLVDSGCLDSVREQFELPRINQ
jgi:superfamily I DNA/RNA helicase